MAEHAVRSADDLKAACLAAQAGDVILVHGGYYWSDERATLKSRRGTPDRPITIRAADDAWISGGTAPDPFWGGGHPAKDALASRRPSISPSCSSTAASTW